MNAITQKNAWAKVQYTQTQLGGVAAQGQFMPGGLDLVTPSLRLQPGVLHDVVNYECAQQGGYSRIEGYERFDGHPSPSAATFEIVQVGQDDFTDDFDDNFRHGGFVVVPNVGDVVTQPGTGAVGVIVAVVVEPTSYLVLTQVTGSFNATHGLYVSSVLIGYAAPLSVVLDARTLAIYGALAADRYRSLISPVPGTGPVRGVLGMTFDGVDQVYAWRDNPGETATLCWKATTGGWVSVPLGSSVVFTNGVGTGPPLDGATLTQGGTASATVSRVAWAKGAWGAAVSADRAEGALILTNIVGAFAAGTANLTGSVTVTLAGPATPITFLPGGRFEFTRCNFSGQIDTRRAYGCDGVNPPFEFDGTVTVPINTGLVPNRPAHITFHKNYLFVAQGASILYSGAGLPFQWTSVAGAGEIATGDTVNGMLTLPGDQTSAAMAVALNSGFAILYGTDPTSFNYVFLGTGTGAVKYSIQNMFETFVLDDFGVISLKTSLNYGNFAPSSLTKAILPFIVRQRGAMLTSAVNREKGQYRMYFRDGYAIYLSMANQSYIGSTIVSYPHAINVTDVAHRTNESEMALGGGLNGFVYHLDIGTSFDGEAIEAYFTTTWDPVKSPRVLKRFRAASLEVQGDSYVEIRYGYELGYASQQIAQPPPLARELPISGQRHWDSGFVWDTFYWDGVSLAPADFDENGVGENIRIAISSGTNYIAAYTINSVIHHYSMRRGLRV